jgi:hypothetical protein
MVSQAVIAGLLDIMTSKAVEDDVQHLLYGTMEMLHWDQALQLAQRFYSGQDVEVMAKGLTSVRPYFWDAFNVKAGKDTLFVVEESG